MHQEKREKLMKLQRVLLITHENGNEVKEDEEEEKHSIWTLKNNWKWCWDKAHWLEFTTIERCDCGEKEEKKSDWI